MPLSLTRYNESMLYAVPCLRFLAGTADEKSDVRFNMGLYG